MSTMFKTICVILLLNSTVFADTQVVLSKDPAVPAVELWYVNHDRERGPEVAIFSNGRVRVRVGQGELWGQYNETELQALVHDLLYVDGLEKLQTQEIRDEIQRSSARTGLSTVIQDAGETVILIQTADKKYRVDGHAVGLCATRFHDCPGIQKLYSAQKRLENVRAVVMVGGPEEAAKLAQEAQQQAQALHGETFNLQASNLSMVHTLADGTRFCQFLVPQKEANIAQTATIITVFETPGEGLRISILSDDGPKYQ